MSPSLLPSTGIHFEPGLWPDRPHDRRPHRRADLHADGSSMTNWQYHVLAAGQGGPLANGKLTFRVVPITSSASAPVYLREPPFPARPPPQLGTVRIPQDLTLFINAKTTTQAMLDNPVTLLSTHLTGLTVTSNTKDHGLHQADAPAVRRVEQQHECFLAAKNAHAASPNAQCPPTMEARTPGSRPRVHAVPVPAASLPRTAPPANEGGSGGALVIRVPASVRRPLRRHLITTPPRPDSTPQKVPGPYLAQTLRPPSAYCPVGGAEGLP